MKRFLQKMKEYGKHTIAHQMSWYTLGQIAVQLFSFLGVIFTARYLGPVNLGLYSFVLNYLSVFLAVTAGMDFYFTWSIAKSENRIVDLKKYFGYKIQVTALLSFIGIILAWIFLPRDVAQLSTIMFLPLILSSCTGFFQYAIVTQKAKLIAFFQILVAASLLSVRLLLIYVEAPLMAFVLVNALDLVLVATLIAIAYVSNKELRSSLSRVPYPSLFETVSFIYSIRFTILVLALWQILLRVDQLVLATFSNAYSLGLYAVAVKISEVPNVLAGILATALIPYISSFMLKNDSHSKYRIRQVMFTYFLSGVVIASGVILFAPYIVALLYGGQFTESIPVLRGYALSIPGMFIILHYFAIYGAIGKHTFQSVVFAGGLILNVGLVYLFSALFGLTGVALATAVTYNLVALLFYLHLREN